jgi:pyridoxal phosphate enzyme (YggS family)
MNESISRNVNDVLARIRSSAVKAGRSESSVRLLAATKNRSVEEIRAAVEAGVTLVGENRVQELVEKAPSLKGTEIHFIGHLQRNKVRQVAGQVSLIHSVDSERLAMEISARAAAGDFVQRVLVQVNVAGEESKSGIATDELSSLMGEAGRLTNLEIVGLSTIAPLAVDPEAIRWVFRRLRELGEGLQESVPGFRCEELSMGMTNDFETAIEEGSTIVRVGTAIFGPRTAGL